MGNRSAVSGTITFKPRTEDRLISALLAERSSLIKRAHELGGSVRFDDVVGNGVPQAFYDELGTLRGYSTLRQFFTLNLDGELVASGDLGNDAALQADLRVLAMDAGESDVLLNGTVIVYDDEDLGNIWRIVITDSELERQQARITWPDGASEGEDL